MLFKQVQGDGSLDAVGKVIGGKVQAKLEKKVFVNACAIRMSYVLNQSGLIVAQAPGLHSAGADGRQYLVRVSDLLKFLISRWGQADVIVDFPKERDFAGKTGLIVFDVPEWNDATGHATLWNGKQGMECSDSCYFSKSKRAYLWVLQ